MSVEFLKPRWGPGEELHPVQIEGLRRMTPARKMELLIGMYNFAITLQVAGLRTQQPGWSEEELVREARKRAMSART